jgi:hypothetical protein
MSAYATKLAEAFSSKVIQRYYESAVSERITNSDYEGQVRDKASVLNVLTFGALALKNYTNTAMTADSLTESNAQLVTDQQKAYYFKVKDLDTFKSYIKNPEGTILEQCRALLAETVDAYVLGLYGDVAAGNRDGTNYTTGTVTVDVTTGVVTPAGGAAFGSSMVGKGFKALGHTSWYRIKSYNAGTGGIVIEDDSDDETSAYTGGAIVAGATFVIQANTALQVTKNTINARVNALATILNERKIPKSDRWLVVPAGVSALVRQAPEYIPAVESAYNEVVKRGLIGMLAGFQVFENQQISGDSTGWHVLAGHKSGITFALGMTESGVEDLIGDFGSAYKGLTVYGAKVIDERRKALTEGFWKL